MGGWGASLCRAKEKYRGNLWGGGSNSRAGEGTAAEFNKQSDANKEM